MSPTSPSQLSGTGLFELGPFSSNFPLERESIDLRERYKRHSSVHDPEPIREIHFLNEKYMSSTPLGFILHAHCWTFLEQVIGREEDGDLEIILEICRERFYENPYDIHEYNNIKWPVSYPSVGDWWKYWHSVKISAERHWGPEEVGKSISLMDPMDIFDIPKLIRHSAQNKARESTKRKTRKWSSVISPSLSNRRKSSPYYRVTQLPCDIVFLILDNLLCHADIYNALIAFNWKVPETYWKSRIPRKLVFELSAEHQRQDDLDWRFLFLGILKLLEQPQLKNRKRVLGLVDEIGRRFEKRTGKPVKLILSD